MMHVVHIIDGLGIGGAERMVVDLTRAVQDDDVRFTIVSLSDSQTALQAEAEAAGTAVHIIPKRTKDGTRCAFELGLWLRRAKVDIVHTHLFASDVWGSIAARNAKVPHIISTEHNINKNEGWLKHRMKCITNHYRERIVAVSPAVKDAVIAVCGSQTEKKVIVIPNGVDVARFQNLERRSTTPPTIAVVGRLVEQKGHEDLLRALPLVKQPYELRIVGDGPLREKIQQRINDLGLQQSVRIDAANHDVESVYAQADLVIIPSRWEGFGLVAIEAMASGCTVLGSKVDGLSQVIDHDVTGLLVDMAQPALVAASVDRLLSDAALRNRLIQAGRISVQENYSLEQMTQSYLGLYHQLYEDSSSQ